MYKYTIDYLIGGTIDIEASTQEEAFKKYNDLTWAEIVENGDTSSEETKIVEIVEEIEEEKPLSNIEKHILDWLGYDETDDEWDRDGLYETLEEQENEELLDIIRDIIKNF